MLKIVAGVTRALAVYGTLAFAEMIKNCMSQDLSWKVNLLAQLFLSRGKLFKSFCTSSSNRSYDFCLQGPAKMWETVLLSLGMAGGEPGIDGEEIAPLSKENVATP